MQKQDCYFISCVCLNHLHLVTSVGKRYQTRWWRLSTGPINPRAAPRLCARKEKSVVTTERTISIGTPSWIEIYIYARGVKKKIPGCPKVMSCPPPLQIASCSRSEASNVRQKVRPVSQGLLSIPAACTGSEQAGPTQLSRHVLESLAGLRPCQGKPERGSDGVMEHTATHARAHIREWNGCTQDTDATSYIACAGSGS